MTMANIDKFRATSSLLFMPTVTEDIVDRKWLLLAHTHGDRLFEILLSRFFGPGVQPTQWPLVFDALNFEVMREKPSFLAGRCHFHCTVAHCGFSTYVPIPFQIRDQVDGGAACLPAAGWCGHKMYTTQLERRFRLVHVLHVDQIDQIPWAKALSVLVCGLERICVVRCSWAESRPWLAFHAVSKGRGRPDVNTTLNCSEAEVKAFIKQLSGPCWCLEWCGEQKGYKL